MSYFTGNRLRDLFMLLQISLEWGRLYPENLDIVDNSKQEDDDLPDTDGVLDAQGWITWKGGECPIPDAKVGEYEIRFGNGEIKAGDICDAIHWHWEHIFNGADYNIVAYRLVKPDHSQLANSEQNDDRITGMEATHIWFDEAKDIDETVFNSLTGVIRYPGKVRVYKVVKDAIDKVEKEINLLKKDYPVMEGFHKHDCNKWRSIPFGIRVRVQRRDKSFSEGSSAGFNWHENGMNTIIGWKPV